MTTRISTSAAVLRSTGGEWTILELEPLRDRNVLVDVASTGIASAAGISFGHYKDFLVPLTREMGERRLQLEIDAAANSWAFRADGVLMGREWWDSAVQSVHDLFDGVLTLKARYAEEVVFREIAVRPFESSPRVSVVMACYRFAERLRVALASWCRQRLPSGALEVIVVNPGSPDATHEIVAAMAGAYPEVRLREIAVDGGMARNKGWMINRAMDAARGEWVWLTDADCVFPPDAALRLLAQQPATSSLVYGERRHLTKSATDALLAGRFDPTRDFAQVASAHHENPDIYPWGFTQIIHRSHLDRIRYREDLDHFAGSDGSFLDDCRAAGLRETRLEGVMCLHLNHPFAWYGTNVYL
jgi:hypothetical protein